MANYQLYRTNVLLGGQMKYDLILNPVGENLAITDFHISPISDAVPFNKYVDDNLLKYNHLDNIEKYYKSIRSSFFNDYIDPRLTSNNIIIKDYWGDNELYDNTYEMGCRRMTYQLYKKQFNFLCPIWLEKLEVGEYIIFQIEVCFNSNFKNPIIKKNVELTELNGHSYHNKFINYFNEYLKSIHIMGNVNSNKLIYIGQNNENGISSEIHGINVENGTLEDKKIILFSNLIDREKPLMEDDYLIISSLSDNKMIAKQLFNFNLCFNLDDILGKDINNLLNGKDVYIRIKIGTNKNSFFPLKDFYSNYSYIQKICTNPKIVSGVEFNKFNKELSSITFAESDTKLNVLDYLLDYKYVHHMNKNKSLQSVVHWSLNGNDNYIFNLYPGFEGYCYDNDNNIYNINYKYDDTPNYLVESFKQNVNSIGWCECIDVSDPDQSIKYNINDWVKHMEIICKKYGTNINIRDGYAWAKNVLYKTGNTPIIKNNQNFHIIIVKDSKSHIQNMSKAPISNTWSSYCNRYRIESGDNICDIYYPKRISAMSNPYFYITCNDWSIVSYKTFFKKISQKIREINNQLDPLDNSGNLPINPSYQPHNNLIDYVEGLSELVHLFNNRVNPKLLKCHKTLNIIKSDSPSLYSTEIDYIKNNEQPGKPVERYLGNIHPTFIDGNENDRMFNYLYKKRIVNSSDYKNTDYFNYKDSNYSPKYKSIGFYIYGDGDNLNYNKYLGDRLYEYNWYNLNKLINLDPIINFKIHMNTIDDSGNYRKLSELIKDSLKSYYNINDDSLLDYIYSKYTYENDFEYDKLDVEKGYHSYIHNVKMELK